MPKSKEKEKELENNPIEPVAKLVLKDMNFEGPKVIPTEIAGYTFKILDKLPYTVGAKAANAWLGTMTSGKPEDQDITAALEEILLSVVVEPKLNKKFLQSDECPQELLAVALSFFMDVMRNMK